MSASNAAAMRDTPHPPLARRAAKAEAGQRGHDNVERIRRIAFVRGRVGERAQQL
jgi:hypothetical protein